MRDCVIDTHILVEILSQYDSKYSDTLLVKNSILSDKMVEVFNNIIENEGIEGKIVASTLAFVEILNQFNHIAKNKFDRFKLYGFIQQPPEWFEIEVLDLNTVNYYKNLPKFNNSNVNIELADALHVATAYQRGPSTQLATLDGKLLDSSFTEIRLIY